MTEDIHDAFPIPEHHDVEVEAVIRNGLNLPPPPGSGRLEHDIGEFLAQSVQVLDYFARTFTGGEHMNTAPLNQNADLLLREMEEGNDLSETHALDELYETRSALRRISKTIQGTAKEVRQIWDETKDHPLPETSSLQPESPTHMERLSSPASQGSRKTSIHATIEARDDSIPRKHARHELNDRGKGTYTCTLGRNCDKGGANPDGTLVVFERNSDYRSHLSKHAKPFRCNLPGCPNVKGFARQDQLKRHQINVPHTVCHHNFPDFDWALRQG